MGREAMNPERNDAHMHAPAARAPETGSPEPGGNAGPVAAGQAAMPEVAATPRRKAKALRIAGPISAHFMISRDWRQIAPPMIAGLAIMAILHWSMLPLNLVPVALASVAIPLLTPQFVAFERKPGRSMPMRHMAVVSGVALPMLLYGYAVARCTIVTDPQGWASALAILAIVSLAGSVISNGRLSAMLAVQIGLWSGVAIAHSSFTYALVALAGCVIAAVAVPRQTQIDKAVERRQLEIEREQARAGALLSEFELSGHGWFWETDRRGTLTYVSPTISKVIGRDAAKSIGRPFAELFVLDAADQQGERPLLFHLSARSSFQDLAVRARAVGEEERWWSISGRRCTTISTTSPASAGPAPT